MVSQIVLAVEESIRELIDKLEETPHFFVEESDIKCWLFHLLVSKEALKGSYLTKDRKLTCLVLTEYPIERLHVDLAVLDPQNIGSYKLTRQKILCAIEIKFWTIAHYNTEIEKRYRDRLRYETQAHRFYVYFINRPFYLQEFKEGWLKYREENESIMLERSMSLVTRVMPSNG